MMKSLLDVQLGRRSRCVLAAAVFAVAAMLMSTAPMAETKVFLNYTQEELDKNYNQAP